MRVVLFVHVLRRALATHIKTSFRGFLYMATIYQCPFSNEVAIEHCCMTPVFSLVLQQWASRRSTWKANGRRIKEKGCNTAMPRCSHVAETVLLHCHHI